MSNEDARSSDKIDALRALAEKSRQPAGQGPPAEQQKRDPSEALAAMAEGQDSDESEQPEQEQGQEETESGPSDENLVPFADEAAEPPVSPDDLVGLPTKEESGTVRRARAAMIGRQSKKAHAHQFKRTMVPLLIVVGAMLFILGAVVAATLPGSGGGGVMGRGAARAAVILAFPLGAFLLFGAWYFHRELTRSEERKD